MTMVMVSCNNRVFRFLLQLLNGILLWTLMLIIHSVDCSEQIGHTAEFRESTDVVKKAILIPDPQQSVTTQGVVTGFHIYTLSSRRNQRLHLQIWRPNGYTILSSTTKYAYKLIGDIKIVSIWNGYSHILLYPEDRIEVQRGDVVGFYFPGYNPLPWHEVVSCVDQKKHLFFYNPRGVNLDAEFLFSQALPDWKPCRIYSYNATIMSKDAAARMDQRYEHLQEKPYGKKPYGKYIPKDLPVIVSSGQQIVAKHSTTLIYLTLITIQISMIISNT